MRDGDHWWPTERGLESNQVSAYATKATKATKVRGVQPFGRFRRFRRGPQSTVGQQPPATAPTRGSHYATTGSSACSAALSRL